MGSGLKRKTGFKKRSLTSDQWDNIHQEQQTDWDFYLQIWDERGGICQVTGKGLGGEPLTTMFHHILPKAKYPQYRYCKWNIILLHPELHSQVEFDMSKVPLVKKKYDELMASVVS